MKIIQYPDERLRKKATDVLAGEIGSKELDELIDGMVSALLGHNGLGLSACQIGSDKNLFIYRDKRDNLTTCINPKILGRSGHYWSRKEGCLSIDPKIRKDIKRAKKVILSYTDREGKDHTIKKEKFGGAIIQHEMDHLKGKLIIDYYAQSSRIVPDN